MAGERRKVLKNAFGMVGLRFGRLVVGPAVGKCSNITLMRSGGWGWGLSNIPFRQAPEHEHLCFLAYVGIGGGRVPLPPS